MSSLVTSAVRSVAGKITRSPLLTRSSRPPASTNVYSEAAIPRSSTPRPPGPACSVGPMADDDRLERLEVFVGELHMEAPAFPLTPELADKALTTFEWTLGGAYLLQRSSIPVDQAPDSLSV